MVEVSTSLLIMNSVQSEPSIHVADAHRFERGRDRSLTLQGCQQARRELENFPFPLGKCDLLLFAPICRAAASAFLAVRQTIKCLPIPLAVYENPQIEPRDELLWDACERLEYVPLSEYQEDPQGVAVQERGLLIAQEIIALIQTHKARYPAFFGISPITTATMLAFASAEDRELINSYKFGPGKGSVLQFRGGELIDLHFVNF